MKTRTLPEALRGPDYEGPDIPTMIQVYDTDLKFDLSRDQHRFTLGSSPENDLAINDQYLSSTHCLIERRGHGLRIYDQQSYNGTFFDGRRVEIFDPRPGDTFVAGRLRLLVLNDEMKAGYSVLTDILGSPDEATLFASGARSASPCDVIVAAKGGPNILITGEPGCDQERLAETIHAMSLRRKRELVRLEGEPRDRLEQRDVIDRASRSTLLLTIGADAPVMDATFVSLLFAPTYHIRIIVIAPSVEKTRKVLGDVHMNTMRQVSLAPLAQRPGAVPRLLDRMFAERNATIRVSDLTPENQSALVSHEWPKNMTGLRVAADRLPVVADAPSLSQAALKLGIGVSSLQHWFRDQLGLMFPLLPKPATEASRGGAMQGAIVGGAGNKLNAAGRFGHTRKRGT